MAELGRLCRGFALYAVLGFGGGLLVAVAAPLAFHARPLTVLSGSMEPTLATGDVVVAKRILPADARVGDVITYRSPGGALITHRVRGIHARGSRFEVVTKGDANNAVEHWSIAADGQLSRSLYRVPYAGRVLARTSSREGKLVLVVAPLLLLGGLEIRRIWRPREAGV
jgi:signal peptidase